MLDPTIHKPVVIITGSNGLLGSRLCAALTKDYRVIGWDVVPPQPLVEGVSWIETDLTSDRSVDQALQVTSDIVGLNIASVVHLAAYYDFSGAPSPLYKELTVEGTRRLLKRLQGLHVEQFVFSSSLLVMKPTEGEGERLDEESATQGEWAYPLSKLAAERVIREDHGAIPAVILRIAGVYDENCHSLPISQQIRRIYEHDLESHLYPGDKDHGQPFIHLEDLVRCVEQTIARRRELGAFEVFLIAEEELMSYEQLQDRIGELLYGERWLTIRIPKTVAKIGAWVKDSVSPDEQFIKPWMVDLADDHYPVDIAKAREKLGWRPRHRLSTTLPQMTDNLRRDPRRWYHVNQLGDPPQDKLPQHPPLISGGPR
jgi:nucleoside-diphosphate-sugar epimerase